MNTDENTAILNVNTQSMDVEGKGAVVRERKGNMLPSILNLTNTVIGAGVLAYPYAYLSTGLVVGLLIVVLSGFSLVILAYASSINEEAVSYQEIIRIFLGPVWVFISELLFVVNLSGACITYLIIVGDCVTPFFTFFFGEDFFLSDRKILISIIACVVIFPLILVREVNKLSVASFFACIGVVYLAGMFIVVAALYWSGGGTLRPGVRENMIFNVNLFEGVMPQAFISIPIVAFSFQGIELICVPVYYELKNPSLWKMVIVIGFALFFSVFFYIIIGIMGYLLFGEDTDPNVLVSFGDEFIPGLIAMFLMGMTVTFSYPLFFFAERLAVHSLFFHKWEPRGMGSASFFGITVLLFVTSWIPSIFLTDISDVLGIIGSIGAISFIFIFPMMILLVLIFKQWTWKSQVFKWVTVAATCLIMIFALILLVAGDVVTIVKIIAQSRGDKV